MTAVAFAIPGDINLPTGGYTYDRRVLALLPHFGIAVRQSRCREAIPDPSRARPRRDRAGCCRTCRSDTSSWSTAWPMAQCRRESDRAGARPSSPWCTIRCAWRPASPSRARPSCYALEKAALALARRVIVTSPTTARNLAADFAVPRGQDHRGRAGHRSAPRAHGHGHAAAVARVGSVVPRKAYDVLVRALAPLRDRDWRLTIAGRPIAARRRCRCPASGHRAKPGSDARIALAGAVSTERAREVL